MSGSISVLVSNIYRAFIPRCTYMIWAAILLASFIQRVTIRVLPPPSACLNHAIQCLGLYGFEQFSHTYIYMKFVPRQRVIIPCSLFPRFDYVFLPFLFHFLLSFTLFPGTEYSCSCRVFLQRGCHFGRRGDVFPVTKAGSLGDQ